MWTCSLCESQWILRNALLHNVRMLERFAPLQTEARDAELPNVVHPFLEIGQDRMRNRVVELVAIMTIQVALFGHVQVRSPWFGVKNANGLLETTFVSLSQSQT